jgi:hypothetical protein
MRNPEVRARFAERQRSMRKVLSQFIVDCTEVAGLTLTMPAATLAGLLDAASWGIIESTAIDDADAHLLESFFALVVDASCDERPTAVPPGSAQQEPIAR